MKKILLLSGGASNEREVSLRSGAAVKKALLGAGYKIIDANPANKDFDLKNYVSKVDCAFIALHGAGGEDGVIQKQLKEAGIPYIGSKVKASKLCWNKWEYKKLLRKNRLPTSAGELVKKEYLTRQVLKDPFVLKPIEGGSTLDTVIAREVTEQSLETAEAYLSRYPEMLLEPLIVGQEITVAVLGNEPLPVIEIIPPGR